MASSSSSSSSQPAAAAAANNALHAEQLAQVNELLRADPENAALLKLRDDLKQLISLSHEVVNVGWVAGDRCMAAWHDGNYYVAKIVSPPDAATGKATVTYLQYGDTVELDAATKLRPFELVPVAKLSRGVRVAALWSQDGMFHDAVIEQTLVNGKLLVKFAKYKQRAEVSAGDVVLLRERVVDETTELRLPEHLIIQPGDADKVKERKRRLAKKLKYEHKVKMKEAASAKRKSQWQEFRDKTTNGSKKKKLKKSTVATTSMFATPDTIDGKVGVVNSGQGMTVVKRPPKLTKYSSGIGSNNDNEEG